MNNSAFKRETFPTSYDLSAWAPDNLGLDFPDAYRELTPSLNLYALRPLVLGTGASEQFDGGERNRITKEVWTILQVGGDTDVHTARLGFHLCQLLDMTLTLPASL